MKRKSLYFVGPHNVEVKEEVMESPKENEVLVQTIFSCISSGTEMLLYRNQIEEDITPNPDAKGLPDSFEYPFRPGYSNVGKVISLGKNVSSGWKNKLVFSFHPHESNFTESPEKLIKVPDDIPAEEATFLPFVETAVNLIMDGRPVIGENVAVLGQGVIGLITTALLSRYPLSSIITIEKLSSRRELSEEMGANISISPENFVQKHSEENENSFDKADLVYEVSGDPDALNTAMDIVEFDGRIVVGSWYGKKRKQLNLGTEFHRNRIKIISSQVSTIEPRFVGRWDKQRRLDFSWEIIRDIDLRRFITHRIPIEEASKAYSLIDENKKELVQILLDYGV